MSHAEKIGGHPNLQGVQFSSHPDWFGAFLKRTDQKNTHLFEAFVFSQVSFLELGFGDKLRDPDYHLEIFLPGGGNGNAELMFIQNVAYTRQHDHRELLNPARNPYRNISVHYNDVSPQMYREFLDQLNELYLRNNKWNAKNPNNKFFPGDTLTSFSLSKFEDPACQPPDVDIALAFQMWQYVGDWQGVPFEENALVKLARTVQKKKGIAIAVTQSKEGALYKFRGEHIRRKFGTEDVVGEMITDELDRLGIKYKAKDVRTLTHVGSFFQNGEFNPTQEGKNILSFMLRTPWDDLTDEEKDEAEKRVTELVAKSSNIDFTRMQFHPVCRTLEFSDKYIYIPGDQGILAS